MSDSLIIAVTQNADGTTALNSRLNARETINLLHIHIEDLRRQMIIAELKKDQRVEIVPASVLK